MLSNLPKVTVNIQESWDLNSDSLASKGQLTNHFSVLLIPQCLGVNL